jgi:hypothetical protein
VYSEHLKAAMTANCMDKNIQQMYGTRNLSKKNLSHQKNLKLSLETAIKLFGIRTSPILTYVLTMI